YMTCAEPYAHNLTPAQVDSEFAQSISGLMSERQHALWLIGARQGNSRAITDDMRKIRQMDTAARIQIYVNARLEDQQHWYSNRAVVFQRREDKWFMIIIVAQFLAFASTLVYAVWYDKMPINPISIFATLTTACFSWLQVKRYQKLAQ